MWPFYFRILCGQLSPTSSVQQRPLPIGPCHPDAALWQKRCRRWSICSACRARTLWRLPDALQVGECDRRLLLAATLQAQTNFW